MNVTMESAQASQKQEQSVPRWMNMNSISWEKYDIIYLLSTTVQG